MISVVFILISLITLCILIACMRLGMWILQERRKNLRIENALYRIGDSYKEASERMQALMNEWKERDNAQ